ncbi:MAG: AbrB/MazE/SpoVT family DNA-binding domain-containing protein [Chloroflexi bacterium]|nr:MAG: AbrB/MazE/SpoVT family DNA-binding domain-containing protein [Chloroflexota bacterium]
MAKSVSVKVSSRYQISVPRIARERLKIKRGDYLLVDVQDGLLILLPRPQSYTAHLAGLHREIWQGVDTTAYLQEEREAWERSADD